MSKEVSDVINELSGGESIESFDDMEVKTLEDAKVEEGGKKPESDEEDTFENGYYEDKTKQTDMLDEEEDGEPKQEEKKEDKKEDDKDDKPSEKEPESKEEEPKKDEEKPSFKPIKVKQGDKTVDLDPNATVKVKVNGKNEIVTIDELRQNYSGEKAWSEKIETANEKLHIAEEKLSAFQEEKAQIAQELEQVSKLLDKEDGDPLEALYYLLDITGRDANTYSKKVFDFMEEKVQEMSEMDDVEKELYWTNQKLKAIENNQAAKAKQQEESQAEMEALARVDKLRESHGVSEEDFVQAFDELSELGYGDDEITPEMVVGYHAIKPHYDKATELCSQFEDDLGDDDMSDLVHETAITLKAYPNISEEEAITISAKKLGFEVDSVDDIIEELNDGVNEEVKNSPKLKYKDKGEDHIESFDDFEY